MDSEPLASNADHGGPCWTPASHDFQLEKMGAPTAREMFGLTAMPGRDVVNENGAPSESHRAVAPHTGHVSNSCWLNRDPFEPSPIPLGNVVRRSCRVHPNWMGWEVLRICHNQVTIVFMGMKGITIKLPDTTLRQLRNQARETGRSVAALVRERVEAPPNHVGESVFALTSDLAGSLAGGRRPAANTRRRFRRS